ncbi:MAG TPA: dual specificity protein phosphatase family protein [Acidimicrobiales bacterium]|nr:dual specificity protein phosphatase family protein [Acidimicrobiales bacterium]
MDDVPVADRVAGRLVLASFSEVGPDPDAALERAGCAFVVSLVTAHEMRLRFPDMETWVSGAGDRVLHLPIPDGSVVDDDTLAAAVARVAMALGDGESVLVHCGAGMGRAGVIAVLTMVSLGWPLDEAVTIVRRSRAGAGPENDEQMAQVERLAPRLAPHL